MQAELAELERRLRADPDFSLARAPEIEISRDHTVETIELAYPGASDGRGGDSRARDAARRRCIPATVGRVAEAHVTGDAAGSHDFNALVDGAAADRGRRSCSRSRCC